MWSRSALRIASYGRTYSVSYRPFTYNSLHKRALKALSNKQQSAAPSIETNDKTTLNNEKTSPPLNENVQEKTETPMRKEEEEEEDVVSSPKTILAAATPTATTIKTPPPPSQLHEFAPRIVVCGVGGGGGNAINNMISKELQGKLCRMHIVYCF